MLQQNCPIPEEHPVSCRSHVLSVCLQGFILRTPRINRPDLKSHPDRHGIMFGSIKHIPNSPKTSCVAKVLVGTQKWAPAGQCHYWRIRCWARPVVVYYCTFKNDTYQLALSVRSAWPDNTRRYWKCGGETSYLLLKRIEVNGVWVNLDCRLAPSAVVIELALSSHGWTMARLQHNRPAHLILCGIQCQFLTY